MFENYERGTLGKYIEQVRGVSYKPVDLRRSTNEGALILLRANNIVNGKLNYDEVQYVAIEKVSETQVIREGDILMCGSSGSLEHVGKTAICTPESYGMTFGAFCKLIRTSGELMPDYIAGYFSSDEYRKAIMKLACGSNINNLKTEHIDSLTIPLPPMYQQEQFAAFVRQSDKSKFAVLRSSNFNLQSFLPWETF